MKFAFALLPIAAALRFVAAGPVAAEDFTKRAPVPVSKLVCDGNSYKCTANLDFADGNWVAQWSTNVFHRGLFGHLTEKPLPTITPVPVTRLTCGGDTYVCTAALQWGDGNWVAQWRVAVFQQALFSQEEILNAMAPVPVTALNCDGDTFKCTANLKWGAGNWVAQWPSAVFYQGQGLF